MKLITYYQTGKIDVFDTATFTATDPFKRDGMNLITEFAIRFDLLEDKNSNEGLVVDVYWYDAKIHDKDNAVTSLDEKKNATLNNALLKASTRIRLISKRELEDVAKITLDGELVEWRQGGGSSTASSSSAKSCCISATDAARQSRSVPARSANSSRMPIRSCPMRSLPAGWACLRPSLRP